MKNGISMNVCFVVVFLLILKHLSSRTDFLLEHHIDDYQKFFHNIREISQKK